MHKSSNAHHKSVDSFKTGLEVAGCINTTWRERYEPTLLCVQIVF